MCSHAPRTQWKTVVLVSKEMIVEGEVWNVPEVRLWRTKIMVRNWDMTLTLVYRLQQECNKIRFTFLFLKISLSQVWWMLSRKQEWRLEEWLGGRFACVDERKWWFGCGLLKQRWHNLLTFGIYFTCIWHVLAARTQSFLS